MDTNDLIWNFITKGYRIKPPRETRKPFSIRFKIQFDRFTSVQGENLMVTMTDSQKVSLSIQVVDKKGNPALLTEPVAWTVADGAILSLQPSSDGLSCEVLATGPLGSTVVTATAGGISGTEVFNITGGAAASIVLTAGTPEEQ